VNALPGAAGGTALASFVLFPLGEKRFALPSEVVAELARPGKLQTFPHTTPLVAGVLVRRGRVVPVCDVAPVLIGPEAPAGKFYLIASRRFATGREWTAIPVTGECELLSGEMLPPAGRTKAAAHEIIEVLDLEKLIAGSPRAALPRETSL
jgi:hypothetical protein